MERALRKADVRRHVRDSDGKDARAVDCMDVGVLLGRRDTPSDGVEDYSIRLAEALEKLGHPVELCRAQWDSIGTRAAMNSLRAELTSTRRDWILLQFTHLMWSRRGFAYRALQAARIARGSGSKLAVIIHDPLAFSGRRWRDRARRRFQHEIMRRLARVADHTFVTVPPERLPWLRHASPSKTSFIPVGSSILPSSTIVPEYESRKPFTVVVFGVSSQNEIEDISEVTKAVSEALGDLRVVVLGRGSTEAAPQLREMTKGSGGSVVVKGMTTARSVSLNLEEADAFLFVRGGISCRRSTAVAALAHGLPVVGYEGDETSWPITEAGVLLGPLRDTSFVSRALIRLAGDPPLLRSLRGLSSQAYEHYFSWARIAESIEEDLCRR